MWAVPKPVVLEFVLVLEKLQSRCRQFKPGLVTPDFTAGKSQKDSTTEQAGAASLLMFYRPVRWLLVWEGIPWPVPSQWSPQSKQISPWSPEASGLKGTRNSLQMLWDIFSYTFLPYRNSLQSHLNILNQDFPEDSRYFDVSREEHHDLYFLLACITCCIMLTLCQSWVILSPRKRKAD